MIREVIEFRPAVEHCLRNKGCSFVNSLYNPQTQLGIRRVTQYCDRVQTFDVYTKKLLNTSHYFSETHASVETNPQGRVVIECFRKENDENIKPITVKAQAPTLTDFIRLVKPLYKKNLLP